MRRLFLAALVGGLVLGIFTSPPRLTRAAPNLARLESASELIQLVNQLRAANGLEPYRVNSALMAAAQAHSDYQAATGTTSHTGKGGSRPRIGRLRMDMVAGQRYMSLRILLPAPISLQVNPWDGGRVITFT